MTEKEQLIEELGVYFERTQNHAPLAARIKALLILSPVEGNTFDEIVDFFQSSKSTVSISVKFLLENGSIEYFTKTGDRKRYFRSKRNYLYNTLKKYRSSLQEEIEVVKKISDFNGDFNPRKFEKHKCYGELYREFLENTERKVGETLKKMEEIKTK